MGGTVKNFIVGALARANAPFLALALTLAATPSFAGWQEQASRADVARLAQLPQIRAAALADAQRGAGRGDARAIGAVMNPEGRADPCARPDRRLALPPAQAGAHGVLHGL